MTGWGEGVGRPTARKAAKAKGKNQYTIKEGVGSVDRGVRQVVQPSSNIHWRAILRQVT